MERFTIYPKDCLAEDADGVFHPFSEIEDDSIDVVITSPPYNNGNCSFEQALKDYGRVHDAGLECHYSDRISCAAYKNRLNVLFGGIFRILKHNGIFVFDINEMLVSGPEKERFETAGYIKKLFEDVGFILLSRYQYKVNDSFLSPGHGTIQNVWVFAKDNAARKVYPHLFELPQTVTGADRNPLRDEYVFDRKGKREVCWPIELVTDFFKIFRLGTGKVVLDPYCGESLLGLLINSIKGENASSFIGYEIIEFIAQAAIEHSRREFGFESIVFSQQFYSVFDGNNEFFAKWGLSYIGIIVLDEKSPPFTYDVFRDLPGDNFCAAVKKVAETIRRIGLPYLGSVLGHVGGTGAVSCKVFIYRENDEVFVKYGDAYVRAQQFAERLSLTGKERDCFDLHCAILKRNGEYLSFIPFTFRNSGVVSVLYYIVACGQQYMYGKSMVMANDALMLVQQGSSVLLTRRISTLIERVQAKSIHSAIGSIMSRNGSHNIGSHVLSALSHNVGTMPDDRMLYQYIQHRMDYIANVTTDFPVWTQPTMFLGEIMKEFFSQRHLLEHIAESEGLSAWEFQNPNLSGDAEANQCGKIQIRIRCKSRNDSSYREVLHYKSNDLVENPTGGVVDLSKDVALAIPGGVVGNHAFYTILENVIRNAAKHGWSTKKAASGAKNLEMTLDYEETEREVVFTIWDNMSDAHCPVDDGNGTMTDIVSLQGKRIDESFIDESGRLRRENWGIAEFKISAGYLMGRDISDIGGLDKKAKKIVEACEAPEEDHNHLGYRFCVRKPRNVVFVLDTNEGAQKNLWDKVQSRKGALATLGIEFIRWEDAGTNDQSDLFASRYVVLPKFGMDEKDGRCPFRVLVWKAPKVSECKDLVGIVDIERVSNAVIPDKTDEEVVSALHRTVALAWLEHLKSQSSDVSVKDNPKFALVVNTGGSESKAGRGLITDDDLLEFVFSHGLRTAIETFCEDSGPLDEGVRDIVWVLHALPPSKPCFRKYPLKEELPAKISWNLLARLDDLKKDMGSKPEKEKLEESRKRLHFEMSPTWERMEQGIDYLTYRHGIPPKTNDASSSPPVRDALEQVRLKLKQAEYEESPHPIERFVQHLCRVFRETEVFLRKYEERIATLPAHFVWLDGKSRSEARGKKTSRSFGFVEVYPQRTALAGGIPIANYSRHDENRAPDETYHEPLSGTQSYFGALSRIFSETDQNAERGLDIVLSRLVENALLKLCVADERVAKFLREHPTMRKTYRAENILVLDDKWVEGELDSAVRSNGESQPDDHPFPKTDLDVDLEWSKVFLSLLQHSREFVRNNLAGDWEKWTTERNFDTKELRGAISRYFDILVLHQGLLDKWLGEASHSQEHVSKFLGIWKKYVKYLVITTGRGTPANIPAGARVLPFPTLESSLFCKYPEKMMLVDTIMNILPAKGGGPKGERQ